MTVNPELKSDSHLPKKHTFIYFSENSLEIMKIIFTEDLFKSLSRLFGHVEKMA